MLSEEYTPQVHSSSNSQSAEREKDGRRSTSIYAPRKIGPKGPLRKGKWTPEEELYAHFIIDAFNKGYLDLPRGTTLRSFLSEQLNCDPMRVTKKFAGTSCIGKSVFCPCEPSPENLERMRETAVKLAELEHSFRSKVELAQSSNHAMHVYMHQNGLLHNPPTHPPPAPLITSTHAHGGSTSRRAHSAMHHYDGMPLKSESRSRNASRTDLSSMAPPDDVDVKMEDGGFRGAMDEGVDHVVQQEHDHEPYFTPKASVTVKRRRSDDDFALNDHDAGDLLLNFFVSVHRDYAACSTDDEVSSRSSGETSSPSASERFSPRSSRPPSVTGVSITEGATGAGSSECWHAFQTEDVQHGADCVSDTLKRRKFVFEAVQS